MNKKILFHYLLSFLLFWFPFFIVLVMFQIFFGFTGFKSILVDLYNLLQKKYSLYGGILFSEPFLSNFILLRIVAYSCLVLLTISNIAFICKQNKFTITMLYFWNNIFFGFFNEYIFGSIVLFITNID